MFLCDLKKIGIYASFVEAEYQCVTNQKWKNTMYIVLRRQQLCHTAAHFMLQIKMTSLFTIRKPAFSGLKILMLKSSSLTAVHPNVCETSTS